MPVMVPQIIRVGAVARWGGPESASSRISIASDDEDAIPLRVEFFAELGNGVRIDTDGRHGSYVHWLHRGGLSAVVHRYYGPPSNARELDRTYKVRESDVLDAIKLAVGKTKREAPTHRHGEHRSKEASHESRVRWHMLRLTLKDHGIEITDEELDRLPFTIEITDEIRKHLDDG